jgi:hypothetical protein
VWKLDVGIVRLPEKGELDPLILQVSPGIANRFEEVKVTYTEYDDETGSPMGNVETPWKVEKGAA